MIKEDDFPQISENRIKVKQLIIKEENKKDIKDEKDILKKFLSPTLIELNNKEKNSYFEIMLNDLANFKYQKAEFFLFFIPIIYFIYFFSSSFFII